MTPSELSYNLSAHVQDICRQLLPNGKKIGEEWCVGSVGGEPGESLKVRLSGGKVGRWADFASTQKGDLIGLYQHMKGVSLRDAIQWAKQYLGITDPGADFYGKKHVRTIAKTKTTGLSETAVEWFNKRGISKATLERYGVVCDGTKVEFPYVNGLDCLMIKYRDISKPKEKGIWSSPDSTPALFGWKAIPENAREVVITEGEPDALAYGEQEIPALSVPYGAGIGDKLKWIETEFENLERFDTIYVSMDMDDAGQKCVEEITRRLGFHRCRIVSLPFKDANETLLNGKELSEFITSAKYLDPKELRAASSFFDEVVEQFHPTNERVSGIELPWNRTTTKFRLRPGEVTAWMGINGHGKTKLLSHISVSGMAQGEKWCIASMEMKAPVLLKTMFQQASGHETPADEIMQSVNKFFDSRCWIVNVTGTAKAERLMELFRYAWKRYGIHHVIIDSLSKCGIGEDDYNSQKDFIDKCGDLARDTGMHVHVVMHSRKRENEDHAPNKMDAKGTGAITDMVDNVVSVWRNKPKEEKVNAAQYVNEEPDPKIAGKPDAIIQIQKQRHHDWEGKIFLWFNKLNHQFLQDRCDRNYDYITEDDHAGT